MVLPIKWEIKWHLKKFCVRFFRYEGVHQISEVLCEKGVGRSAVEVFDKIFLLVRQILQRKQ